MCLERDQIMPLWSPQMKRMKRFNSLRKLRNKKQGLRNRRRIHPVTPDIGGYRTASVKMWKRDWLNTEKVVEGSDSEVEGDAWLMGREDSSEEEEEEMDDEEIERHCGMMCRRAQERKNEEMEVMEVEDEGRSGEESEEYPDSEDEMEPRLKPVFIRKKDRVTVQEREAEALKQKELEQEAKRMAGERRKYTLKIVEETKKELEEKKRSLATLDALNTDDENDEEYEAWKVLELRRIKQEREDREALEKEKAEMECMRNPTEEERRAEFQVNGKVITNKAVKGKSSITEVASSWVRTKKSTKEILVHLLLRTISTKPFFLKSSR